MVGMYCYRDVLPFSAMVTMECANVGFNTLFKAATLRGMSYHVFVVYAYSIAALVLLPSPFFSHRIRVLPPLNFSILSKIGLLGLIGCSSQIMGYTGINLMVCATKDFLTSLYHPGKKRKKQRQRSMENLDSFLQPPPSQPQPPPPPPPPPSIFQNLFSSKKGKAKKIDSVQPPPRTATKSKAKIQIALEQQSQANLVTNRKPPLPAKTSSFNSVEENMNRGSQSLMNSIPPPPPLPPFKMQDWKFPVHGDYVRIKSNNSSRSGSPDSNDAGPSSIQSTSTMSAMDGRGSPPPMFYASPDVGTKADTFIARFKTS